MSNTVIDSGVVVEQFFNYYHPHLKEQLPPEQGLLSQSLTSLIGNYAQPNKSNRLKRYFWVSEQEEQQQEAYFSAVKKLLDGCDSILNQFADFYSLEVQDISENKQVIYPYLASVFPLFNTDIQTQQVLPIPEDLSEIYNHLHQEGFLQNAKGLRAELKHESSDIAAHLKAIYQSLYVASGVFLTLWGQAAGASIIVISGPWIALPLVISVSLLVIGAAVNVADIRHKTKMNDKLELDRQILTPLIGSLEAMQDFLNMIFRIDRTTQRTEANLKQGVDALNRGAETLNRIEKKIDNQRPNIIFQHNTTTQITEGAMKQLLDAYAKGIISLEALRALTGQTSAPLQIAGMPPVANEPQYLPVTSESEESSSTASSRSSTPPTSEESQPVTPLLSQEEGFLVGGSSSSKGKGKAVDTVNVEMDPEEFAAFERFKKQQIEGRLKAA